MFRLITVPLHMSLGLPSNSSHVCLETDEGGVRLARNGEGRDHSHQQDTILNMLEEEREVMSKPVY